MPFLAACIAGDDFSTTADFLSRCRLAGVAFRRRERRLCFDRLLRDPVTLSFIPEDF